MKLRNKRTGEIVNAIDVDLYTDVVYLKISKDGRYDSRKYDSLAEFNEEWEDAPAEAIQVHIEGIQNVYMGGGRVYIDYASAQEAEKAVEKLKALTEAKEDGLKVKGYYYNHEDLVILADIGKCNKLTLDTLFEKEID